MSDLTLPISAMRYDITLPLLEGRVDIPGVKLERAVTGSMAFSDIPQLREGNFGLWDLNLGYLLPAIEAGWQLRALPVFTKRKPAYQFIFCRAGAGIRSPKELEGKRVGARNYRTALTVWVRGLLQEFHGLDLSTLRWLTWADDAFPVYDSTTSISRTANPQKSPVDALLDGDIDVLVTDISDTKLFRQLEDTPSIRRLFPDYESEDQRLYQATGIYTPVHLMVMSSDLDRRQPDLARRLYEAFVKSKEISDDEILSDRGGFAVVYLRERMKEQMARWGDPFKHGFAANQRAIETFMRYNLEQGMIREPPALERIFATGMLET